MSRSPDDPSPLAPAAGKPTLEMLLRAKRAERPDDAFWSDFERSFRQKQLAASIEPRPWWLGVVLLGRRLGPMALPASAFAAALVAVVAVRLHAPLPTEAGLAQAPASTVAPAAAGAEPQEAASPALVAVVQPASDVDAPALGVGEEMVVASVAATSPALPSASAAVSAAAGAPSAPSIPVVATLLELPATAATQPTPSELTIAQNLATVRAELAAVTTSAANGPGFAAPQTSRPLETVSSASLAAEPVAPAVSPRHARLLAMAEESMADRRDLAAVRERMAHRLAHDDTNYGSSSRLGVGGDRFSLSF